MDIDDLLKNNAQTPEFEFKEAYWLDASNRLDVYYRNLLIKRLVLGVLTTLIIFSAGYLAYDKCYMPNQLKQSRSTNTLNYATAQDNAIKSPYTGSLSEVEVARNMQVDHKSDQSKKLTVQFKQGLENSSGLKDLIASFPPDMTIDVLPDYDKFASETSFKNRDLHVDPIHNSPALEIKNVLFEDSNSSLITSTDIEKSSTSGTISYSELETLEHLETILTFPESESTLNGIEKEAVLPASAIQHRFKPVLNTYLMSDVSTFPSLQQDGRKVLGGNVGFSSRYYFHPNWFVASGLSLGIRTGSFDPSVFSTQRSLLFGPKDDAFVTRPEVLLHLNVPLRFGFVVGKNEFYAGMLSQILTGVYGSLQFAQYNLRGESPSPEFQYTTIERGWMDRSGFRSAVFAGQLGYGRRVQHRTTIGFNLNVIPRDWLTETYGQVFDFDTNQFTNVNWEQRGLVEQNWILSFFVLYRL